MSNKTAFCIFWIMSKTWCQKKKKNPIIFQSAYPYLLSIRILSWFGLRRWKVGKKGEIFHVHHYMTLGTNYCCRIFWTHFLLAPQTRKKSKIIIIFNHERSYARGSRNWFSSVILLLKENFPNNHIGTFSHYRIGKFSTKLKNDRTKQLLEPRA